MVERRLEIEVSLILERATKDLRRLRGDIGKTAKRTKRDVGGTMSRAFRRLALRIGAAAAAYIGFRAALRLGRDIVTTASELVELDSAMEVIFQESLPGITKELDRFAGGMSRGTIEMKEATQQFGIFFRAMEFGTQESADLSVELTKLAVDFQSLVGGNIDQLIQRITSSLTGESEAAKRLGANIRVENLARIARNVGIQENIKDVSEQTRVLLRSKELIRALSIALGDATRTQDQFANQLRGLTTSLRQASGVMGDDLIKAIQQVVEDAGGLDQVIQDLTNAMELFIDVTSTALSITGKLAREFRKVQVGFKALEISLRSALELPVDDQFRELTQLILRAGAAAVDTAENIERLGGGTVRTLDLNALLVAAQRGGEQAGNAFATAFATAIRLFVPAQVELMSTFEFGIAQAQKRFDEFTSAVETGFRTTVEIQGTFLQGIDDAADSIVEGEFKFKSFFSQLLKDLAKVALRTQLLGLFGGPIGGASGGLAGLFGGLFGGARGGISGPGPGPPLQAMGGGGITDGPTVIAGEKTRREAFVPLPGAGRSIPVEFRDRGSGAGGGGTVNIFVQSLDPRGAADVIMAQIGTIERGLSGRLRRGVNRGMVEAVRQVARG